MKSSAISARLRTPKNPRRKIRTAQRNKYPVERDQRLQWAGYFARRAEDTARRIRTSIGNLRAGTDTPGDHNDVVRGIALLHTFASKIHERTLVAVGRSQPTSGQRRGR